MFEALVTQEEFNSVSVKAAEAHAFALPASASDAEKRAAAAQLAKVNLGKYDANFIIDPNASDDFDGSILWNNRTPFASGDEYLEKMKAVNRAGRQAADTPEWKEWAAAGNDRAKRLAIAQREHPVISTMDELSHTAGFDRLADEYFTNAPEEIVAARQFIQRSNTEYWANRPEHIYGQNWNLFTNRSYTREMAEEEFKSKFGLSYQDVQTQKEEAYAKLRTWKTKYDEDKLISRYQTEIETNNLHRKYQILNDILAPESVKVIDNMLTRGTFTGDDIERFKSLPDRDKAVVAGFIRNARLRQDNALLYDAGYAFLDSAARLGVNSVRAVGRMVAAPFTDREALNEYYTNRALIEQAVGYDPAEDHNGFGRAFIGVASTLPYMATTAIPYAGPAISALAASQQIADQISAQGGDVSSLGAQAFIAGAGVAYMAVERVQWGHFIGKEITDLEMRLIYANIGKTLAKNITKIGARTLQEIGKETFEEMVQGAIEQGAVAFGLGQDVARAAAIGFIEEFDSVGTMTMLAGVGIGAKAARFRYNNRFSNAETTETVVRLLQAETVAGELTKQPVGSTETREQLNTLRRHWFEAWKQGDNQAAADYFGSLGLDANQSARLTGAFEAEYLWYTQQGIKQSPYAEKVLSPAEVISQALGAEATITPISADSFQIETTANGKLGRFTVFTNADPETDMATPGYAASVEQATATRKDAITADQWLAMTPEERTQAAKEHNLTNHGWFKITTPDGSASLDANQVNALLTGEIHLTKTGAAQNSILHESFHAVTALMRQAGALTEKDIALLKQRFGEGSIASEAFNEEAAAEAYRAYASKKLTIKKETDGIFARIVEFLKSLLRLGDGAKNMHNARADVRAFISSLDAAETVKAEKSASVEGGESKVEGISSPTGEASGTFDDTNPDIRYQLSIDDIGKKLSEIEIPEDEQKAELLSLSLRSDQLMQEARKAFLAFPKHVTAADGERVLIHNPERRRAEKGIEGRIKHLMWDNDKNRLDVMKGRWIPMIVQTVEGASVKVRDHENNTFIYIKRYQGGMIHMVVVDGDGKTLEHRLVTQFSYVNKGRSRRENLFVVSSRGAKNANHPSSQGWPRREDLSNGVKTVETSRKTSAANSATVKVRNEETSAENHSSSDANRIAQTPPDVKPSAVDGVLDELSIDPEWFDRFGDPETESREALRERARVMFEKAQAEGRLAEALQGYGLSPEYLEAIGVMPARHHVTADAHRYRPESWLTAYVAGEILAEGVAPDPGVVKRRAEKIGAGGIDISALIDNARKKAEERKEAALNAALGGRSMPQLISQMAGEIDYEAMSKRLVVQGAAAQRDLSNRAAVEMERHRVRLLKTQVNQAEGTDYHEMQIQTGANLTETLLAMMPEQKKETRAPDAQPATDPNGPLSPEHQAELERINANRLKNLMELLKHLTSTKNKRQEETDARREKEEREKATISGAAPEAVEQAELADGAEIAVEAEGLPAITPAMLKQFNVDFTNPDEVALFIRLWAERHLLATSKHRSAAALWKDPVQRRRYRETAKTMLNELADALMEADTSRVMIQKAIDEIESDRPDTIERNTAHILGLINKHGIRQSRAELTRDLRKNLKHFAIQGEEFDALEEDIKRKITAHTEVQARYLRRIVIWSRAQCEAEMDKLTDFIESQQLYIDAAQKETGREISAADDKQILEAQQRLGLLARYGGLKNAMPAEIKQASKEIISWLQNEQVAHHAKWLLHQQEIKKIGGFFRAGIRRDGDYAQPDDDPLERFRDSLIGMVETRLGELIRFATGETRANAQLALEEIAYLLTSGSTDYHYTLMNGQRMMGEALAKVYGSHKKGLDRLEEKLDPAVAKQIYRQGLYGWGQKVGTKIAPEKAVMENGVTISHAINLLGQLEQKFYAENVRLHDRLDHARLLREALTPEDLAFLNEVRALYAAQRELVSPVVDGVTGLPVMNPDPLYIPARMKMDEDGSLAGVHRQWSPLAASLTPRRKNKRDFDEKRTILDVYQESLESTALAVGYGSRGLDLRAILANPATKEAIRHFHGDAKFSRLYQHLDQILRQAPEMRKNDPANKALHFARKWVSYFALSGNMLSALKQAASVPVWANVIGFKKLWQHMTDIHTPAAREAIAELNQHKAKFTRYGAGWSAEVAETFRDPATSWVEKAYQAGMAPNQFMDYVPGIWIAQGVYRDLTATYRDRGMSEAEAKERAAAMTWRLIEQTQQSGRVENLTSAYRNGGDLARLFFQFSTSPLQQLQYQLTAWRDFRDGVEGGRARLARAVVINHIIVPGLMLLATRLWKNLLGDDDELKAWQIVLAAAMGQFGSIVFLGSMTERALSTLFSGQRPRSGGGNLIPAEGIFRIGGAFALTAHDLITLKTEDLQKDLLSIVTQTAAPARHAVKVIRNYGGEEDPKKKAK